MPATVRFFIGRASSGKTRQLHAALTKNAALFVPEQFTYETERALGGRMGVRVLSVSRLRERVINSQDKPYLSPQGRRMVVRRAAYTLRSSLNVFSEAAKRPGFAQSMDSILCACRQARITPEYLRDAANNIGEADWLSEKLTDVALIYEAVADYLDAHYMDSEDAQDAVIRSLPSSFLAGADIYFDGFEAVNEQLFAMLTVLMRVAESITFTFCMDPDSGARDASIFLPERRVYERIRDTAVSLGCEIRERVFDNPPLYKDSALYRLETDIFAINPREMTGNVSSITLIGASDRAAEVSALVDAVISTARNGVRYREMAVIASDMSAYAPLVQRAFKERNVPLFLDARRGMNGHPVVELMLCAVRAASSLHSPELMRMVKTGLAHVSVDDAEAFENYCLMRGLIGGKVFEVPFPPEQEGAERARQALIPPLLSLREGLKAKTAGQKAIAVYAYLEALDIQTQLSEESLLLRAEGRFALMEEHAQVWGILMEMLEQLHGILGAVEMSSTEFLEVLSEALSAYQVGLIPATADQVLFGDFGRTRSTELKALFLLGCNEGLMPPSRADDNLLDDAELTELKNSGFPLWDGAQAKEQADRYAIYRALGKANDKLWIGFSYSDGKRELLPATLIKTIQDIFPDLSVRLASAAIAADDKPNYIDLLPESERSGFMRLIRNLDGRDALSRALHTYYSNSDTYGGILNHVNNFRRSAHMPGSLPKPQAQKLYGTRYFGSVSRIEAFRRCPYSYFLEFGLKIKPRREYGQKKTDTGSFAHMALERFTKKLIDDGVDFGQITREESDGLINSIFPDCLAEYEKGLLVATARSSMLKDFTLDAIRETAWQLVKSISAGDFMPFLLEARFGADGALPAVTLPGGARLSGVVDRIDLTQDGFYRVIDYKTGNADLKYERLYDGLSLQLPVYLAAAKDIGEPAAMYYQPVKEPIIKEGKDKSDELKLRGLTSEVSVDITDSELIGHSEIVSKLTKTKNGELKKGSAVTIEGELEELIDFAIRRASETVDELLSGRIEAKPVKFGDNKTACSFCPYLSVCRFDKRMGECRSRYLPAMKKDDFFNAIRG